MYLGDQYLSNVAIARRANDSLLKVYFASVSCALKLTICDCSPLPYYRAGSGSAPAPPPSLSPAILREEILPRIVDVTFRERIPAAWLPFR